jgi:predicted tellurium resistance membrane protein TerC
MEDRERRLQWLPAARARRERATAWGIILLHTLPLIVACLLALLLGRPEISAATLGLAMLTLGLVRTLTRPRSKLAMPRLREVRRSH